MRKLLGKRNSSKIPRERLRPLPEERLTQERLEGWLKSWGVSELAARYGINVDALHADPAILDRVKKRYRKLTKHKSKGTKHGGVIAITKEINEHLRLINLLEAINSKITRQKS